MSKPVAANKFLTAKCLAVRAKLERIFANGVTNSGDVCLWKSSGVSATLDKLAKRYKAQRSDLVSFVAPTHSPDTVRVAPRCRA